VTVIVSDNSPLNLLIRLGVEEVLPRLFGRVLIPPEVVGEMHHQKTPPEVRVFLANPPTWLQIKAPTTIQAIPDLDPGETAAISLAIELSALLMIDENEGRMAAKSRGLEVIGAIGVLERAANAGLIPDLGQVHSHIRTLRFFISDDLLRQSLDRHLAFKRRPSPGGSIMGQ
jgi:predicted nucleic acid-binding protein